MVVPRADARTMGYEGACRHHRGMMTILYDLVAALGIVTLIALAIAGFAGGSITDLVDGQVTEPTRDGSGRTLLPKTVRVRP